MFKNWFNQWFLNLYWAIKIMLICVNYNDTKEFHNYNTREINYGNSKVTASTYMCMMTITSKSELVASRVQLTIYIKIVNSNLFKWYSDKFTSDNWYCCSFNVTRKESTFSLSTFITKWPIGETVIGRVMVPRNRLLNFNCSRGRILDKDTWEILQYQSADICKL